MIALFNSLEMVLMSKTLLLNTALIIIKNGTGKECSKDIYYAILIIKRLINSVLLHTGVAHIY